MDNERAFAGEATDAALRVLPEPSGVGRPSAVVGFEPQIRQWLRAEPTLSGAAVLNRARRVGYRGGKSAFYELIRRLRMTTSGNNVAAPGPVTHGPVGAQAVRNVPERVHTRDVERASVAAEATDPMNGESTTVRCRCGGPLRFDVEHLADAARLGLRDQVSLFWKCMICGRSRRSDETYPLARVFESLDEFVARGPMPMHSTTAMVRIAKRGTKTPSSSVQNVHGADSRRGLGAGNAGQPSSRAPVPEPATLLPLRPHRAGGRRLRAGAQETCGSSND